MKDKEILQQVLDTLHADFQRLGKKIELYETEDSRLEKLVNSRQRIASSLLQCIAMKRDPKIFTPAVLNEVAADLAKMMMNLDETKKKALEGST